MTTYLLHIFVSFEQELALHKLFSSNGWNYRKAEFKEVEPPSIEELTSGAEHDPPDDGPASITVGQRDTCTAMGSLQVQEFTQCTFRNPFNCVDTENTSHASEVQSDLYFECDHDTNMDESTCVNEYPVIKQEINSNSESTSDIIDQDASFLTNIVPNTTDGIVPKYKKKPKLTLWDVKGPQHRRRKKQKVKKAKYKTKDDTCSKVNIQNTVTQNTEDTCPLADGMQGINTDTETNLAATTDHSKKLSTEDYEIEYANGIKLMGAIQLERIGTDLPDVPVDVDTDGYSASLGLYYCPDCTYTFELEHWYTSHKRDGECLFVCPNCHKQFTFMNYSGYKRHLVTHRKKRGAQRLYDLDAMVEAVLSVQEGKMSLRAAATAFGVPKSTLQDKVTKRTSIGCSHGGKKPMDELDNEIIQWIIPQQSKLGKTPPKRAIVEYAKQLCSKRPEYYQPRMELTSWVKYFFARNQWILNIPKG